MGTYVKNNIGFAPQPGETEDNIPSGVYSVEEDWQGNMSLKPVKFPSDETLSLPGLPIDLVLEQTEAFWTSHERYAKYRFLHKRGFMFYGPPGCGKTCLTKILCDYVISKDGVVIIINEYTRTIRALSAIRKIESERRIMTLAEDIDSTLAKDRNVQEPAALSLYSGQESHAGVLHVATTNNPEDIADRFIKRPGRFDLVVGIHAPTAITREAYLRHVCGTEVSETKLKALVEKTEGLGLSYLKEIATSHLCLDKDLDEVTESLRKSFKTKYKGTGQTGFSVGYHFEDKEEEVAA